MRGLTRIDRYLAAELTRGYLVVAAVLMALFSLIAFLEELENVGDGGYGALQALGFVGMTTPSRVLRLLPFVTLFGGALALWQLGRRSELVVLRAAGMSLHRIALATLLPSAILLVATPLVYEFVAPALYRDATISRDQAIGRADQLAVDGFWSRRGETLVEVRSLEHGRVPTGVRIYELSADAGIEELVVAASADPDEDGNWRLVDAERRVWSPQRVVVTRADGELWRPWWAEARHLRVPPVDSLSFTDLRGYIAYLKRTGQPTDRWELAYWRMWLAPLSALLTGLLAIPIVLTGVRDSEFRNVGFALMGGLGYYLGDQMLASAGVGTGLSPLALALAGPALLALIVAAVLRRVG
ncbi:MAG TPA: LPS export ABC transporter permease LptG [Pseudomonadales bacterium]|nr:LPS export ABC transporter permease LptG [Pseudomonadales bacterium]